MGVEAMITRQWPTTENLLLADGTTAYATHKAAAIQEAIQTVYAINPGLAVPTLSEVDAGPLLIQEQVADIALTRLIPLAIDYYMQLEISKSENYQGAGSATTTMHNRVDILTRLLDDLREEITAREPTIVGIIGVETAPRAALTFFTAAHAPRRVTRRRRGYGYS